MTCMMSGNRWMLDVEHFGCLLPLPLLPLTPTLPSPPLLLFPHASDKIVVMLSSCLVLRFLCLYPGFSTPPFFLLLSLPILPPTLSTCMLVFSVSSLSVTMWPETLSKPPVGNIGPQAAVWCQHMCTWTLVPSLCVTLVWMPRPFVLPATINSCIIRRLNTSHLQARGFYLLFNCALLHCVCLILWFPVMIQQRRENWCPVDFRVLQTECRTRPC